MVPSSTGVVLRIFTCIKDNKDQHELLLTLKLKQEKLLLEES